MKVPHDAELDLIRDLDRFHIQSTINLSRLFSCIADADEAELWRQDGCTDMGQWVAARFGISSWHARRWVNAAGRLKRLPVISAAFERGEIGVEKVVELARYAIPEVEVDLLAWAQRVKPQTIREEADRVLVGNEDAKEAERERFLSWYWDGNALEIHGRLGAVEGAQFIAAIDAVAKDLPTSPDREDHERPLELDGREPEDIVAEVDPHGQVEDWDFSPLDISLEHRRADALVLVASAERGERLRPEVVVVHADLEALQSSHPKTPAMAGVRTGDTGGTTKVVSGVHLENGVALHPQIAARLACDCSLEVVTHDGSRTIGIKRAARNVPRWLRRQMLQRDCGSCLFPGCGRLTFLQAHHIKPWEVGGETNLDNLATLCHFHHKLVHEYGWRMRLGRLQGTAEWFRPDGRLYDPHPVLRAPPLPLDSTPFSPALN